jgi:hypothetical protein
MTLEEAKFFGTIYHHKFIVLQFMNVIIHELIRRAEEHDQSKFGDDEFLGYLAVLDDIRKYPYGTPEHEEMRKKHAKVFETHYVKNRHHPEYHKNGIEDMTLIDLVELLIDWKAASMRQENGGNITNSIEVAKTKYNIHPQLVKILENTAKECKM